MLLCTFTLCVRSKTLDAAAVSQLRESRRAVNDVESSSRVLVACGLVGPDYGDVCVCVRVYLLPCSSLRRVVGVAFIACVHTLLFIASSSATSKTRYKMHVIYFACALTGEPQLITFAVFVNRLDDKLFVGSLAIPAFMQSWKFAISPRLLLSNANDVVLCAVDR